MEEYKSNSHRSREGREANDKIPERRTEKIVSGSVTQRKKSGVGRIGSALAPGDMNSVKNYILMDVLIPSIKRAISDIVCNGINMLLGEPNRSKSSPPGTKVSYRSYYNQRDERRDYARPRAQSAYSYDDLLFESRGDAEKVLYSMEEMLDRFDSVSIGDMFDLAGVTCNYTDNKYGWTDLEDARVEYTRDGYIIKLPRATLL